MKDGSKNKKQLIDELQKLRKHCLELERIESTHKDLKDEWKRYEFIVNTSRDFLSLIDSEYKYITANKSYCLAHDKEPDEIIGKHVWDIWGREVYDEVIKGYLDRAFSGEEVSYQARFKFSSLGHKEMLVTYYPY